MKEKNLYDCHVFVCTNKKEGGRANCADKGANKLRDDLKLWAKEKYGKKVRINSSGCLDFCSRGIVSVIYPKGEWQLELKTDDLKTLQDAIDQYLQDSSL